jgi:oxalate---CoA ligase
MHFEFWSTYETVSRRVGFGLPHEERFPKLSASVEELQRNWDVVESLQAVPTWDFVWNATVEEGREKQLLQQPFTTTVDDAPPFAYTLSDAVGLAESALKVIRVRSICSLLYLTLVN